MRLGIHGQYIVVDRQNKIVIVIMSSQPSSFDAAMISLPMNAAAEIKRAVIACR